MGQSLVKNYLHIVFSTKHRKPFIDKYIESELHAYLGGICKRLECQPIIVGGYVDHVHILCRLSKKISLSSFMQELKANSSKWIKTKGDKYQHFFWQDGYGAFSVNPSQTEILKNYILNQHEHHRKTKFKTELRDFLAENEVDYDEKYVWD